MTKEIVTTRIGLVAVVSILAILVFPARASAAAPATVKIVPSAGAIRPGARVIVKVRISGAANVGSVPFTLHYDSSVLELVASSSTEGGFLRQGGAATSFLVGPGSASRGGGAVVGLSRLKRGLGARGKGTLCKLTFLAKQPGISPLTFSRASLLDPAAVALPVTFRGSSIKVRGAP